ncbi:MAG TPA: phage tail sheath subtilisin-like domain-containing protein [Frankiaceae bacterium]|jgi:hypothetical protein|nr:phage tail sheath subtilisin-like domain-containing protein [Frankiaceae bacterium]
MPVQTTYPGVYVEERPSGARTIVGVSTSVTAFVGGARQGPVNVPVRVRSVAEYVRAFGAPVGEAQPMGHAVAHFFANGGSDAIVVRVAGAPNPEGTQDRATASFSNAAPAEVLVLRANGPGSWANKVGGTGLEGEVDHAASNPDDLFNLVVRQRGQDPRTGASVVLAEETFRDLSMSPSHPRHVSKVLPESALVAISGPAAMPASAAQGVSTGKVLPAGTVTLPPRATLRVVVNFGAPADLRLTTSATPSTLSKNDAVTVINAAIASAGLPLAASQAANRFTLTTTGTAGPNQSVTVQVAPTDDASQALGLGLTWSQASLGDSNVKEASGAAALRPVPTAGTPKAFAGGRDFPVTAAEVVPASGTGGIYAFGVLDFPRFNLLCLPDVPAGDPTDAGDATASLRNQALGLALSHCKRERAFLVVDTSRTWTPGNTPNVGGIAALGEHGAIYYPRVKVVEQGPGGLPVELSLPPSGAVAGVMARIDTSRGIWKAPAGLEAGVVGVSGPARPTDDAVSGLLNPRGFNVLRTFPGAGTVVWGARTLKGADSQASEFKYVPVRRLTDYIASSLFLGTQFAVFEPNDPDLWGQLRLAVTTFMRGLFTAGAFQQSSKRAESDSFFVTCDETVNPQSEVDLGRVNVVVGFAPLKPAEFVIVTITQMTKLED